jgi:hypothetical protein
METRVRERISAKYRKTLGTEKWDREDWKMRVVDLRVALECACDQLDALETERDNLLRDLRERD